MHRKTYLLLVAPLFVSIIGSLLVTGCSANPVSSTAGSGLTMAPMESMPESVKSAPVSVQQAYQFAAANPGPLKQVPCYCGCGTIGHTSNYTCYVQDAGSGGKLTFDDHALGCSICVDITQDVMRLLKEKKTIQEIRVYVDKTYAKYGSSNMQPAVSQ